MKNGLLFIGAGGHAKVIYDIAISCLYKPVGFIDPQIIEFLALEKIEEDALPDYKKYLAVISIGGTKPSILEKRLSLYYKYQKLGLQFPALIDSSAKCSPSCKISDGVTIGTGASVNASSIIEECVIINTQAVIEHDAIVKAGAHICPGALVLGGATIGSKSLIGAGSIILPGASVPASTIVPAGSRFPK